MIMCGEIESPRVVIKEPSNNKWILINLTSKTKPPNEADAEVADHLQRQVLRANRKLLKNLHKFPW